MPLRNRLCAACLAAAAIPAAAQPVAPGGPGAASPSVGGFYGHARLVPPGAAVHPDLLTGETEPALVPRGVTPAPCRTVFGYLPYWVSPANVRYDHLTHVGAFSIGINGQGEITTTHGWPWTGVVADAHAAGTKVVVVVTLFEPDEILALVTSEANKEEFFRNIVHQVAIGDADGVNIDFEGPASNGWAAHMPAFLADLRAYLNARRPGSHVSIATPAVNWGGEWDLPAVADSCDAVFIMGYAFWGSFSSSSGPCAPLTGGGFNITNTVDVQYAGVDPDKIILGVPYYGNRWRTDEAGAYASVEDWESSLLFEDEQSVQYGRLWDAASQTPWYRWSDGGAWRQVWYDDAVSIGRKWDLVETRGLQGGGMWALGYDGARPELWDLVEERFMDLCAPPPCPAERTGDSTIDVFDLLAYLDGWFAADAGAEMTGDASIDVFDLLSYLDAWFAGC